MQTRIARWTNEKKVIQPNTLTHVFAVRPHSGLINYLELYYCYLPEHDWVAGLLLLGWIILLFIWLTAMVDFLVPSLATLADYCGLKESVAGVTFLALGNGCSDIFSMTAAAVSGPRGMKLALGEVMTIAAVFGLQFIFNVYVPTFNSSYIAALPLSHSTQFMKSPL